MTRWALRWRILAETAALVAVTAAGSLLYGVAGAVIAGLAGLAVAAIWGAWLSRLLARMTESVLRIGSVDRTYRVQPGGPAELNRLGRAINRLVDRLNAVAEAEFTERDRLDAIFDALQDGVIVVDADGVVETVNPAAIEILGGPGNFSQGQLLTNLTNNYEINRAAVESASRGEARQAQVDLYDLRRFVQVLATPLAAAPGEGKGRSLVLVTDLSEQRRVDVTRREFVSNASHELRTPIAAIKASVETLQRGAISDPAASQDFLRRIAEDIARMDSMVSEMLELSRLESGQTPLHLAPVDPGALLRSVTERLGTLATEAGVTVSLDLQPSLPVATLDRAKIEQVMTNLVGNSLKHTSRGGVIKVTAGGNEETLVLRVIDSGSGIAPEHLPHIFERFYKANPARNDGGSGLGLAIAKHIVQAHGGSIDAHSRPGRGATFTVTLPVSGHAEG